MTTRPTHRQSCNRCKDNLLAVIGPQTDGRAFLMALMSLLQGTLYSQGLTQQANALMRELESVTSGAGISADVTEIVELTKRLHLAIAGKYPVDTVLTTVSTLIAIAIAELTGDYREATQETLAALARCAQQVRITRMIARGGAGKLTTYTQVDGRIAKFRLSVSAVASTRLSTSVPKSPKGRSNIRSSAPSSIGSLMNRFHNFAP